MDAMQVGNKISHSQKRIDSTKETLHRESSQRRILEKNRRSSKMGAKVWPLGGALQEVHCIDQPYSNTFKARGVIWLSHIYSIDDISFLILHCCRMFKYLLIVDIFITDFVTSPYFLLEMWPNTTNASGANTRSTTFLCCKEKLAPMLIDFQSLLSWQQRKLVTILIGFSKPGVPRWQKQLLSILSPLFQLFVSTRLRCKGQEWLHGADNNSVDDKAKLYLCDQTSFRVTEEEKDKSLEEARKICQEVGHKTWCKMITHWMFLKRLTKHEVRWSLIECFLKGWRAAVGRTRVPALHCETNLLGFPPRIHACYCHHHATVLWRSSHIKVRKKYLIHSESHFLQRCYSIFSKKHNNYWQKIT